MTDLLTNLREIRRGWFLSFENEYTVSLPRANEIVGMVDEAASRISQQDAELERVRRELAEHKDAKWKVQHVDTMNDIASLRIALEGAEAALAEARKAAFIEAAEFIEANMVCHGASGLIFLPRGNSGNTIGLHFAVALRDKAEETGRG